MAKKIRAKLVLQLRASGHSRSSIAASQKMSKRSVIEVFEAADALGISYDDVADKDDGDVYKMLFPDRHRNEDIFEEPDWEHIHKELGRTGVTLQMLHGEYVDGCRGPENVCMSYPTFCRRYHDFTTMQNVTSHIEHKAGHSIEVDWSGPTMSLVDATTGEVSKVHLFVASLPFSRYDYVEPTLDMKQDTWLLCHVHLFAFLGGSVPRIIPDNLKTGVVKHPREGEVVLNEAYRTMAAHYGAAVLPARVTHPKDKPSAEGSVGNIATDIIAALRDITFTDFGSLKAAVAGKLAEHNSKPFQKREGGSRTAVFEDEERAHLQPLPGVPYEICAWVYGRKVAPNCHVAYAKNYYSCNWRHVGCTVDLRVTATTLEVYLADERIATHALLPAHVVNRYSTHEEDMPEGRVWCEWDAVRIRKWAERIGASCTACIDRIFESVRFEEQGYDAALALLRLSRKYGSPRVEKACSMALSKVASPRYRHISTILEGNHDKIDDCGGYDEDETGFIRGADYYGRSGR